MPKSHDLTRTKRIFKREGSFKIAGARILPKIFPKNSKRKIHGFSLRKIEKLYKEYFKAEHGAWRLTNIRFYEVPGNPPRFVIKGIARSGYQYLNEILFRNGKPSFTQVGEFFDDFSHREITLESLKGKGLGSAVMKSYLAMQRRKGKPVLNHSASTKSTLLLFLRNGFKIKWDASTRINIHIISQRTGIKIKNEEDLIKALKKISTPEDLKFPKQRSGLYISVFYKLKK